MTRTEPTFPAPASRQREGVLPTRDQGYDGISEPVKDSGFYPRPFRGTSSEARMPPRSVLMTKRLIDITAAAVGLGLVGEALCLFAAPEAPSGIQFRHRDGQPT